MMAGNKDLKLDPITMASHWYQSNAGLIGGSTAAWNAGQRFSEETILEFLVGCVKIYVPFCRQAAKEAIGARSEAIFFCKFLQGGSGFLPIASSERAAIHWYEWLKSDDYWGADRKVLLKAYAQYSVRGSRSTQM